jgi:YggT family protein
MALLGLLNTLVNIYIDIVILDVILSWVLMAAPRSGFLYNAKRFVERLTEPALYPIRRALQSYTGSMPLDFSPIVLIILLEVLQALLARLMFSVPLG